VKEQGGDFVIFSPEGAPIQLLREDDLAKVLLVPLDWDQRMAPALHQLPVDGIAIALEGDAPLTVQHLLAMSGLRRLAGKPLLLFLPHKPSPEALQVLRDSGVDCIMVDIASLGLQGVEEVRRQINALPRRQRRPEGRRPSAIVPQMAVNPAARVEEEEEEEDV
jgi:CheY-like chemotaxis protein